MTVIMRYESMGKGREETELQMPKNMAVMLEMIIYTCYNKQE